MNISHLEYFIEIVHQKSINKAAQKLYLNRSSLMNALNSLENEIGTPLLNRNPQGVTLTDKGAEVYEGALKILEIVDNWHNPTIVYEDSNQAVNFTISALPAINATFIPRITSSFKKDNSNCSFNVKGINNSVEQLMDALTAPDAIVFGGIYSYGKTDKESFLRLLDRHHYMLHYLFSSKFVIYCNTDSPLAILDSITLEQMQKLQLVTLGEISSITNPITSLSFNKSPYQMLNNQQIFSTLENDKSLAAFLPNVFALQHITSQNIVTLPVSDYTAYTNYFLAYHKDTAKSPKYKQLINHILNFNYSM